MALFKIFKGNRDSLNDMPMHDGYAYFCMDDGTFHIDYADTNNTLSRKQINASEAEKLIGFDVSTVLNPTDIEIPTSNAVYKVWEATDGEVSTIKNEIDETCKSGTSESLSYMEFNDVAPDSKVNLTWSGNAQTKEFTIRGSKNFFDLGSEYGVGSTGVSAYRSTSWEVLQDGGICISQIPTDDYISSTLTLPAGTYTLSIDNVPEEYLDWFSIELRYEGDSGMPFAHYPYISDNFPPTFTLDSTTSFDCKLYLGGSEHIEKEFTLYPQFELGETATSYENWTTRRTETVTKGSAVSLYSPTTTIFTTDDSAFSVETKLDLKSSIISYIDDSADEVLKTAKDYTDEEIAKFDFIKVVDSLPSAGLPNRVYLVPKTDTQTQDLFDEYAWINKGTEENPQYAWEWFTTKQVEVDLTNYTTTTAVNNAIIARSKLEHPVGSIYLSSSNTNPNSIFGFGTWELIAKDRMLIGAGNKYSAGATGGAETVALSTTQVPKVEGRISIHNGNTATNIHMLEGCFTAGITNTKYIVQGSGTSGAESIGQIRFSNGGTGAAHNNMPPYYGVYIWLRTA